LSVTKILGFSTTSITGSSMTSSLPKQPAKEKVTIRTTIEIALTRMVRRLMGSSITLLLYFRHHISLNNFTNGCHNH